MYSRDLLAAEMHFQRLLTVGKCSRDLLTVEKRFPRVTNCLKALPASDLLLKSVLATY